MISLILFTILFTPTSKVTHTCNPNTWKVKAEESEIQEYLQLSREFEAISGYMKFCLKKILFKKSKAKWIDLFMSDSFRGGSCNDQVHCVSATLSSARFDTVSPIGIQYNLESEFVGCVTES